MKRLLTRKDLEILAKLRGRAEAKRFNASVWAHLGKTGDTSRSPGDSPGHRAYLSNGVVVVYAIEEITDPLRTPAGNHYLGWVRHVSVSRQVPVMAGSTLLRVKNVHPDDDRVREIATALGMSGGMDLFDSPNTPFPVRHGVEVLK